jgi:hypothetical protein
MKLPPQKILGLNHPPPPRLEKISWVGHCHILSLNAVWCGAKRTDRVHDVLWNYIHEIQEFPSALRAESSYLISATSFNKYGKRAWRFVYSPKSPMAFTAQVLKKFPFGLVKLRWVCCAEWEVKYGRYCRNTVRSESRWTLRLRYVDLVFSIEVAVEVCCRLTVFSC